MRLHYDPAAGNADRRDPVRNYVDRGRTESTPGLTGET